MQQLLYSYLIQNGSLALPGIGTIYVRRKPAVTDFVNQRILPPEGYFELDNDARPARNDLFDYIARHKQTDQAKAIQLLNEFSFNLKNEIKLKSYYWESLGTIKQDAEGNVVIVDSVNHLSFLEAVHAERVVHEHAEHYIKVGDTEKTNVEMAEWLQEREAGHKITWSLIAVIIGSAITMLFVLNYIGVIPSLVPAKNDPPAVSVEIK